MVISRIRQHVATHNWFAVTVDVAVVVIGVFLGTQANNWNEARIEQAAAAEYRAQIIEDLASNEMNLAARRAYYGAARSHAIAALERIESPSLPRGEPFLVDAFQASQVWLRPLVRNGYDEMTGAGLSRRVGDRPLRSRLIAYYTQIRQFEATALATTSYRERLRAALPYKIQTRLLHDCGERTQTMPGGTLVAALPDRCVLGLDPRIIATGEARLAAADLGQDLTRHIADIDQKMSGFERNRRLAHELRKDLQATEGS